MGEQEVNGSGIRWIKIAALVALVIAGIYASQHPHSIMAYVVRVIIAPTP